MIEIAQKNIPEELSRTVMLLGEDNVKKLLSSRVAVFGLGGVGGQAAEALCRAGVGQLWLIDRDTVAKSNINRQIFALQETVDISKTEAACRRLRSIAPWAELVPYNIFYSAETAGQIDLSGCSCVVDAIDTVTSKLLLIERCVELGVPVVSCMGAGNKLDPTAFRCDDISRTSICPLARVMRKELRRRGIEHLPVVYSTEPPAPHYFEEKDDVRRSVPGSTSFCAPAAGLALASLAVKQLLG